MGIDNTSPIQQPPTPKQPSEIPKCDWKYCRNLGELFPVIVLPMPSWIANNRDIEMEQSLNVCNKHADENHLEWYMDDDGWVELTNALSLRRLPIPDRKTVHVVFRPQEDRRVEQ